MSFNAKALATNLAKLVPVEILAKMVVETIIQATATKVDNELYNKLYDQSVIFVKALLNSEKDTNDKVVAILQFVGETCLAVAAILAETKPFTKSEK